MRAKTFLIVLAALVAIAIALGSFDPSEVSANNKTDDSQPDTKQETPAPEDKSVWDVHSFKAEMDGHKIWNARSEESKAYGDLTWPVDDTTAHVTIGKDKGKIFAVFSFSTSPNLVGGNTQDGYNVYRLPISFDGKTDSVTVTQVWGSPDLYARYPKWLIKKIEPAKVMKIRMPWYRQSSMYFEFDVADLKKAISKFD